MHSQYVLALLFVCVSISVSLPACPAGYDSGDLQALEALIPLEQQCVQTTQALAAQLNATSARNQPASTGQAAGAALLAECNGACPKFLLAQFTFEKDRCTRECQDANTMKIWSCSVNCNTTALGSASSQGCYLSSRANYDSYTGVCAIVNGIYYGIIAFIVTWFVLAIVACTIATCRAPSEERPQIIIAYILWALFGYLGVHRCFLGSWCLGIAYFFTFGFCGVGVILDLCYIPGLVHRNFEANKPQGYNTTGGIPMQGVQGVKYN